jgi:hypothetical protein
MLKQGLLWIPMLAMFGDVLAQDPVDAADEGAVPAVEEPAKQTADSEIARAESLADPEQPRAMSGMSILGNEEAPKALVIVPWKASEMGADLELSDTLDDRAHPVDREVFMRELSYYELRSEN